MRKGKLTIKSLILPVLVVICYLFFVCNYLLHSHQELLQEYLEITPCFYRNHYFIQAVFTPAAKDLANSLAWASIPLLLYFVSFLFLFFNWSLIWKNVSKFFLSYFKFGFWLFMLTIIMVFFLREAYALNPVSTDEAFAAYNFAEKPIAHIFSYYPLPNNHIFFDFLNHYIGWFVGDYVVSGRFISVFFYVLLILGNFIFLQKILNKQWLAFLITLLLAQQFIILGFAVQSRGYALSYLLQWLSFIAVYYYFFGDKNHCNSYLFLLVFANVLGFWTIPTFLYFFVFQIVLGIVMAFHSRQLFLSYWLVMGSIVVGVFLLYLPVFCYSGIQSVFANKYIDGSHTSLALLSADFLNYAYQTLLPATFGFCGSMPLLALLCLLLPVLISPFVFKNWPQFKSWLLIIALLWLSVFLLAAFMHQMTFLRVVGFQMHLTLLFFLIVVGKLLDTISLKKRARQLLLSVLVIGSSVGMYRYNTSIIYAHLYGQDTNSYFQELNQSVSKIPMQGSVWLSDESFYWRYLLAAREGVTMNDCNFNNQNILIVSEDDSSLSFIHWPSYHLVAKVSWFSVYQHN